MQFYRADYPTIMSGLVVRYKGIVNYANHPEVNVSRDGVSFDGCWPTMKPGSLAVLRDLLLHAERQHIEIMRHDRALPFDSDPVCVVRHIKPHFGSKAKGEVLAERKLTD